MNNGEIISLAKHAHKTAKTRDFREQMKPLETWMGSFLINFYHLSNLFILRDYAQIFFIFFIIGK